MNWKQKLGSRKFWSLLAALVVAVLTATGAGEADAVKITGIIAAVGACVVYMLAEAVVDKSRNESDTDE